MFNRNLNLTYSEAALTRYLLHNHSLELSLVYLSLSFINTELLSYATKCSFSFMFSVRPHLRVPL